MIAPRQFGLALLEAVVLAAALCLAGPVEAREKDTVQYGAGLIVNVPASQEEVVKAVDEVVQNGIIRGSKEYSKDEYISGANSVPESRLFPSWTEGGKVFYKVRLHALDPLNFKNTNDMGTVAVRYIVMGQDDKHTVLRIDAVFSEDFRHVIHASNGSVESSEYKQIHDHIEALELMKQQTVEAEKMKDESSRKKLLAPDSESKPALASEPQVTHPAGAAVTKTEERAPEPAPENLQDRVQGLRRQVERRVKASGTPLKTAPFHSATNVRPLPAGTEVLLEISTPYWYGVETHEGQHGWVLRDDLEEIP